MAEHGTATAEPRVDLEDELSLAEEIKYAELAIANMKPVMQTGEVFPGSNAYNRVLRALTVAGADEGVVANWQGSYEELIDKFDGTDPEGFVAELKAMLEGFLADTKAKLGQGVEKGQAE